MIGLLKKGKSSIEKSSIENSSIEKSSMEISSTKEKGVNAKSSKLHSNKQNNETYNNQKKQHKFFGEIKGIRAQLLLAFAIPVLLLAIYGSFSYTKTSEAIITNFESSSTSNLNATKDYILMGIEAVANKSYDLVNSENFKTYYNKSDELNINKKKEVLNDIKNEVSTAKNSNPFFYSVHTFAKEGNGVSTVDELPSNFYNKFLESPEGQQIQASTQRYLWVGDHSFLDETLNNKQINYATSIIRKMSENNGFVIIDVPTYKIIEPLSKMQFGEGSIIGFITAEGKETLVNTEETSLFNNLSYYQDILTGSEVSGFSYEKYQNKDYLFIYSKVGNTGATLCALVPEDVILEQAETIKIASLLFLIFACVVAIVIGTFISGKIGGEIAKLSKSIAKTAKGDLTTEFETKRKDEFKILADSLKDMVGGMRKLIKEVAAVGSGVSDSADALSQTSSDILGSTKGISIAIDEIGKGVIQQASEAEQCLSQMSKLSDQVSEVYDNTYQIEQIAKDTKTIVGDGLFIVDELGKKSTATTDITQVVIDDVSDLELQSRSIGSFVTVINGIAEQTNLLALNASIEAARAGESGRGFAVVAEEIRKLADQSVTASSQINEIVTVIQKKTQGTVVSAKQAEDMVKTQMEALAKTIRAFENINQHVSNLVNNLNNISMGVKEIETAKDDTLDAIRNITAVSQQTATSSEEVSATASNQISSVEYLSDSAIKLAEDAKKLEAAILRFTIS